VIIDEIDRLAGNWRSVETIRDLADQTMSSIIMVGMIESERKLARFKHLYYRMKAHILRFKPLSEADTRRFIEQVCEVKLDESAISKIHEMTGGKVGEIIPELHKVEVIAKSNSIKTIKVSHLSLKVA